MQILRTLFVIPLLALGMNSLSAQTIVDAGNYSSSWGGPQALNGTTTGLTTNLPGGSWVWGDGWNWSGPSVTAMWDSPLNAVALGEENTVASLALGSSGGYTKPTTLTISADIGSFQSIGSGISGSRNMVMLGFWSLQPTQSNGAASTTNFTGLVLNIETSTIQVYSGGALQGSAVSVSPISFGSLYSLSYTVDTTTGALSSVVFNGSSVSGLTSSAFTDPATSFVGVASYSQSRGTFDNLLVTTVPEPSAAIMLALGGFGLVFHIRRSRSRLAA